jgi:hypothetical protein
VINDWMDVLRALIAVNARFLVVGAHAMAVHGVPRGTQDIDIWIETSATNADRVWRALTDFGAPLESLNIARSDFELPGVIVQFGLPPNRIDILTEISGVSDFQAAFRNRVDHRVQDLVLPFLGRADLVTNKRASARRKDLADLEALGELE